MEMTRETIAFWAFGLAAASLAWQIISKFRENRISLKIYQKGSDIVTRIHYSKGMTYITLETVVINTSTKATAVICGYSITQARNLILKKC